MKPLRLMFSVTTSDGYDFYVMEDGQVWDSPNYEDYDLSYNTLEAFAADVYGEIVCISDCASWSDIMAWGTVRGLVDSSGVLHFCGLSVSD